MFIQGALHTLEPFVKSNLQLTLISMKVFIVLKSVSVWTPLIETFYYQLIY